MKTKEEVDLSKVDEILGRLNGVDGSLISILQEVQEHYGYVPRDAVFRIAESLQIFPSSIYGVVTFYTQFNLEPKGKNLIHICRGTACHVKGSERIVRRVRDELGLKDGEDTTQNMVFTVENVACVGACSIAPVVIINKQVFGTTTADKTMRNLKKLIEAENE